MGSCTASGTFTRAMQLVLRGMTWEEVIVYLGDIIVVATDFDNMISSLQKVFNRFRELNIKLKPRKCTFFKREVEFLGKLVSGDGIRIAPDKIETVKEWPIPTNAKQLISFLGFMNYHRSHTPSFAEISADLYTLTNADSFVWTDRHQYCFNRLKQLATSARHCRTPHPTVYSFWTPTRQGPRWPEHYPNFRMES